MPDNHCIQHTNCTYVLPRVCFSLECHGGRVSSGERGAVRALQHPPDRGGHLPPAHPGRLLHLQRAGRGRPHRLHGGPQHDEHRGVHDAKWNCDMIEYEVRCRCGIPRRSGASAIHFRDCKLAIYICPSSDNFCGLQLASKSGGWDASH